LFGNSFHGRVLEFFQNFPRFAGAWSSSSIDTRLALKFECHSKTTIRLKECSESLMKHLKGFGSGFTELHAKLDADTMLNFAIHHREMETRSRKSTSVKTMCVHSAESRGN
jgi:hypothetical protein